MNPVHIFLDGQELEGWTGMTLHRAKKDLTGSLSVDMFFSYMPAAPVAVQATRGKEITVYIGGHLAFTGKVDKRQGNSVAAADDGSKAANDGTAGSGAGFSRSASIGADEYTVKLTARGKTKKLIDSSHQHPTTNMKDPSTKDAVEKLVQPWGVEVEWKAEEVKLDRIRFRDGAKAFDEIDRIGTENGHFIYETRDGKLRVTDDTSGATGEPLILGENILKFSAEQSEENSRAKVKVKGQRTKKGQRGKNAVLNTEKQAEDKWDGGDTYLVVQHFGDGTPEALERRANFEMNKRSAESKKLSIEVFHVQSASGAPWDIGDVHYCEVPPEGIFDDFEVTELTYEVKDDKTLSTRLTLSPPPKKKAASGGGGLGSSLDIAAGAAQQFGAARRAAAGVTFVAGQYPSPWSGPDIAFTQVPDIASLAAAAIPALLDTLTLTTASEPPEKLPPDFGVLGSI